MIPRGGGILHHCGWVILSVVIRHDAHATARVTRSTTRRSIHAPFTRSFAKSIRIVMESPAAHGPRTGLHGTGGPRTDSHFVRRGWRQRFHNHNSVVIVIAGAVATPRETLEGAIAQGHGGARGSSLLQGPAGFGKVFHTKGPALVGGFDKLFRGIAIVTGATAHLARRGVFCLFAAAAATDFVAVIVIVVAGDGNIVHGHREGLQVSVHGAHETRLLAVCVAVAAY